MINFSLEEITRSILYASSFGILFSFSYTAIRLLKSILLAIPDVIREIFVFDRLFCTPDFKKSMLFDEKRKAYDLYFYTPVLARPCHGILPFAGRGNKNIYGSFFFCLVLSCEYCVFKDFLEGDNFYP